MKTCYIDTMLQQFSNSVLSVIENVTSCFRQSITSDHHDHLCSSPTDTVHVDRGCKRSELPVCATVNVNVCCRFCGFGNHERNACPARRAVCDSCYSRGHYSSVCEKQKQTSQILSTVSSPSLAKALVNIRINGNDLIALVDTGSTDSFIHDKFVQQLGLPFNPSQKTICLAAATSTHTIGTATLESLEVEGFTYNNFQISVLPGLCHEVIIGHDLLSRHNKLIVKFGGEKEDMQLHSQNVGFCNLVAANIDPPKLLYNIKEDCRPIACKSRKYSDSDKLFISEEVSKLLKAGIIERSHSPWRAQVLITNDDRHRRRMVIDYSRTINKFTELDAYPLPRLDDMAFQVSRYKVYSALDFKSAYHQIPIDAADKQYTAFEADGGLYQFCRIPFGVTNGVAAFQRIMDQLIQYHELSGTFVYLDNITVCGGGGGLSDKCTYMYAHLYILL